MIRIYMKFLKKSANILKEYINTPVYIKIIKEQEHMNLIEIKRVVHERIQRKDREVGNDYFVISKSTKIF